MHSVKRHGKEIETPLFRFAIHAYLLALVVPYCLAFRLIVGRLPKRAKIEFNGHNL
jgi:hypothetical protein